MSQEEYIAILFNDCGFDGPGRRAWLKTEYGRAYPDELSPQKKHEVIERLKKLKQALSEREPVMPRADRESGLLFDE